MIYHSKFKYVNKVVNSGMSVLLYGPAGTGKSTLAKQIATENGLDFYTMSMTKQMSVNAIIGFTSINGTYIPTQFRKAFEFGGIMLIDEIDAADSNTLLVLNTIENGYVAFPDGIVDMHENFRLIATSNPVDEHSAYTGRSKLDLSTIDRFFGVELPHDNKLESKLIDKDTMLKVKVARRILKENGSSLRCTMRDAIRIHKLSQLDITEDEVKDVIFNKDNTFYAEYSSAYTHEFTLAKAEEPIIEPIIEDISTIKPNDYRIREIYEVIKNDN